MEINQYFYMLSFKPEKLVNERLKIEQKYSGKETELIKRRGKVLLPKLLEKIRSTPEEQIEELCKSLKKVEILLLIYEGYPFPKETAETVNKINQILTNRYSVVIGRAAWGLFQHLYASPPLQDLLRRIYLLDQFSFLNLPEHVKVHMRLFLSNKRDLLGGLAQALIRSEMLIQKAFELLKVESKSKLEAELMRQMFIEGMVTDSFIKREGVDFITQVLNGYPMNIYKEVMKCYLENRKYDQFHFGLMKQAIERLRDPRERMTDWEFLGKSALEEVQRWLIQDKLKKLFENDLDNKRFNYWRRFIDYMQDVQLMQNPMIAFIYFENFVIVEYGNIGAAYFYHREGFDKVILSIARSYKFVNSRSHQSKEAMLKIPLADYKGIPLFIDKLNHVGRWQEKFDHYMRQYLGGTL
ncbi:hypothetical protein [Saccharibacillus alkalitolerans]|uniref:Zorya protein ZorC EH domain-containing protein n=1 Tax=Saccharibacillus alkalitolerans TaxID=2705290 RepID=A0ABX0F0U5_9BACL|nr:hypothetical protein [Saccharibacillus alkalitolerans]NGZ74080.1 hypothetical protein [Saccharibacillus alkalitolerans]